jgi:hypothetical protein
MHLSKKNEFKILIFIMALIITFGLAMGGNYLHARYNIENPLLAQIKDLPGVESITIEKKDDLTAAQVIEAGCNVLVSGSYIFGARDMNQAIKALREAASLDHL